MDHLPETAFATGPEEAIAKVPEVPFEDFLKMDLRCGTVLEAEAVPKSKKLLRLQVSFSSFERQILAGIAGAYAPEDLIGQTFVFLVNIPPRKLMGLESHGMILGAGEANTFCLMQPINSGVTGCRLG